MNAIGSSVPETEGLETSHAVNVRGTKRKPDDCVLSKEVSNETDKKYTLLEDNEPANTDEQQSTATKIIKQTCRNIKKRNADGRWGWVHWIKRRVTALFKREGQVGHLLVTDEQEAIVETKNVPILKAVEPQYGREMSNCLNCSEPNLETKTQEITSDECTSKEGNIVDQDIKVRPSSKNLVEKLLNGDELDSKLKTVVLDANNNAVSELNDSKDTGYGSNLTIFNDISSKHSLASTKDSLLSPSTPQNRHKLSSESPSIPQFNSTTNQSLSTSRSRLPSVLEDLKRSFGNPPSSLESSDFLFNASKSLISEEETPYRKKIRLQPEPNQMSYTNSKLLSLPTISELQKQKYHHLEQYHKLQIIIEHRQKFEDVELKPTQVEESIMPGLITESVIKPDTSNTDGVKRCSSKIHSTFHSETKPSVEPRKSLWSNVTVSDDNRFHNLKQDNLSNTDISSSQFIKSPIKPYFTASTASKISQFREKRRHSYGKTPRFADWKQYKEKLSLMRTNTNTFNNKISKEENIKEEIRQRRLSGKSFLNRHAKSDDDIQDVLDYFSPKYEPTAEAKEYVANLSTSRKRSSTLDADLKAIPAYGEVFLPELKKKYAKRMEDVNTQIDSLNAQKQQYQLEVQKRLSAYRKQQWDNCVLARAKYQESVEAKLKIQENALEELHPEGSVEEDEEEEVILQEITPDMDAKIQWAMTSRGEELINAYNIPITIKDLNTFRGLNWLNDEVINFYMQMIVSRSKKEEKPQHWPKVYAMQTFFYPKLVDQGYNSLKRWTRKVDIFDHDLILVPVHLGAHWCLATIDFKKKGIFYYDSMGGDNNRCLKALIGYLEAEHMDKKKSPYDTSDFICENVKEIPQQNNQSDCGMFTCKNAEYLSREALITFTQEDMPYFRRRIIYEIVTDTLLHP